MNRRFSFRVHCRADRVLAWLMRAVFLALLVAALPARAACGPVALRDHVFINEFFFDAGNLFLEIYVDDTARWSDLSAYSVVIYKQEDTTARTNDDPLVIPLSSFTNTVSGGDPHFRYYVPSGGEQSYFSPDSNVAMGTTTYADKQVQIADEIDLLRVGRPTIPTYYPTNCADFTSTSDGHHNVSIPGSLSAKNVARIADGETWYLMPGTGAGTADSQGVSNIAALGLSFSATAAPNPATVNADSVVTLSVTNGSTGSTAITYAGASVTIALGTGLTQTSGQTSPWSAGNIAAGSVATTTLNVTAAAAATYSVTATLSFNYSNSGNTTNIVLTTSVPITFTAPPHLRIRHDGSGSVCTREPIQFEACQDASCLVPYTGTVSVTMSPGTWWSAASGGTAGSTFSFAGGSTTRYLEFSTVAPATLAATVLTPSPATVDCINTLTGTASCVLPFASASFVFAEDLSGQVAGSDIAVAGRSHDYRVSLLRWDGGSPPPAGCGVETSYTGSKALQASYVPAATHPSGAIVPSIGGTALGTGAVSLALTFSNGVAGFNLETTDVGKFALAFADAAYGSGAGVSGSSSPLTVRPFALDVAVAGNSGATAATGTVLGAAGSDLNATVRGVLWQAGDDGDNDGIPDVGANLGDNTTTPGYDVATTLSAATPITPAAGTLGILGGTTTIGAGQFNDDAVKGAETVIVTYPEVGSFTLNATVADFLGTSGLTLTGVGVPVGRFTPHHLTTAVTNGCSSFTYSGQPFVVTVEARNLAGVVTQNYAASGFAKDVTLGSDDAAACVPTVTNFSNTSLPAASFAAGSGSTAPVTNVAAPLPISYAQSLAAPASITVCAKDADAVTSHGQTQGTVGIRNGRVNLGSAFGSAALPLVLPAETQFWTGAFWARNTADAGCTASILPPPTLPASVSIAGGPTFATTAGAYSMTLSAASALAGDVTYAAVTGFPDWLRYPWNGCSGPGTPATCVAVDFLPPRAKVSFGLYRGSQRFIYRREVR